MQKDPRKMMQQQQQSMNMFAASEEDIKFGDACIAAPFTS
jgi:hypothetical protein